MNNLVRKIYNVTLTVGLILMLFGVAKKIMHHEHANEILTAAYCCIIIYTVIGLYEVFSSKKIEFIEKTLWLIGFLLINTITAVLYFAIGRKRVS